MDKFDPKFPNYDDDSDYNTNANSYYKDLGRKTKLIKLLAKRIWEYDERLDNRLEELEIVLNDYLSQWNERIENLDEEVSYIFIEWLEDGTLEQIINHDVLGNKADKSYVDELNEDVTTHLAQTMLTPEMFGVKGDGVTDDSEAISDALKNASGNVLKFEQGKTYSFGKKIVVDGLKSSTIDFNHATFLDLGHDLPTTNDTVVNNPVGIKFVNCENITVKGLEHDTNATTVFNRIPNEKANLKSASLEFNHCKNLKLEAPTFNGSQGSNPESGYPYHVTLDEALNFGHLKVFNCENVEVDAFKLEGGSQGNEVLLFGKCTNVKIKRAKKSDVANLASWGKFIDCKNVEFEQDFYRSDNSSSFIDASGDRITIKNIALDYPNGKVLDVTNEWGEVGGSVNDILIKNVKGVADTLAFVSKMAMDFTPENTPEFVSPVQHLRVEGVSLGDENISGKIGGQLFGRTNRMKRLTVNNSSFYNFKRWIKGTVVTEEEYFEGCVREFNSCDFINNHSSGETNRYINSLGKNTFNDCYFYNQYQVLQLGDEHAAFVDGIENSQTSYTFNNCTFENAVIKPESNVTFYNCKFINCSFLNDSVDNTEQTFYSPEFIWNESDRNTSIIPNSVLFAFRTSKKVVFHNPTFKGTPIFNSGSMFNSSHILVDSEVKMYNPVFDFVRMADEEEAKSIVIRLENDTPDNKFSAYISQGRFHNKTIPATIIGTDSTHEKPISIVIEDSFSDQTGYITSISHTPATNNDIRRIGVTLINNTFSNREVGLLPSGIDTEKLYKYVDINNKGVVF